MARKGLKLGRNTVKDEPSEAAPDEGAFETATEEVVEERLEEPTPVEAEPAPEPEPSPPAPTPAPTVVVGERPGKGGVFVSTGNGRVKRA